MAGENDFLQSASNAVAGGLSAPIDALAWLLRAPLQVQKNWDKAGITPGQAKLLEQLRKPTLGSENMQDLGLTKPTTPGSAGSILGETAGNLLQPLAPFAAAAKTAALVPFIRGMNKVPAVAASLEQRAAAATAARAAGKTPEEIWAAHQLAANPSSGLQEGRPAAEWLHETAPPPAVTEEMLNRLHAGEQIPMREFRPDPELHAQYPWTGDVLATNKDLGPQTAGSYAKAIKDVGHRNGWSDPTVKLNLDVLAKMSDARGNGVITHEINHGINDTLGQTALQGYAVNPLMPEGQQVAAQVSDILRAQGKTQLADTVEQVAKSGPTAYTRSMGERMAELDRHRELMTPEQRAVTVPQIEGGGIPDNVAQHLGQVLYGHGRDDAWSKFTKPDAPQATQNLLNLLRRESPKNTALPLPPSGVTPEAAALYKGGNPDLYLGHSAMYNDVMHNGELPQEFYNLSQSITHGKGPDFGNGELKFVPQLGKFDPKTEGTVLSAFDNYTPRWPAGQGKRVDSMRSAFDASNPEASKELVNGANARLADRLTSSFVRGGARQEDTLAVNKRLPRYGEDPKAIRDRNIQSKPSSIHDLSQGPRFQSFKHYEDSPYGAARLTSGPEHEKISGQVDGLIHTQGLDQWSDPGEAAQALKNLANGAEGTPYLQTEAKKVISALRKTKSDYGELKSYGPTGINSENFAGIMVSDRITGAQLDALRKQAEARGLQVHPQPTMPADEARLIDWMQAHKYGDPGKSPTNYWGTPLAGFDSHFDMKPWEDSSKSIGDTLPWSPQVEKLKNIEFWANGKAENLTPQHKEWLQTNFPDHPFFK